MEEQISQRITWISLIKLQYQIAHQHVIMEIHVAKLQLSQELKFYNQQYLHLKFLTAKASKMVIRNLFAYIV